MTRKGQEGRTFRGKTVAKRLMDARQEATKPPNGHHAGGWRQEQLGDAYEGQPTQPSAPDPNALPEPVPASKLRSLDPGRRYRVDKLFPLEGVSLWSGLPKAGKSTAIASILAAVQSGQEFCGLPTEASRILVVSEEPEPRWAARRDRLGYTDDIMFICCPFIAKPKPAQWERLILHADAIARERTVGLVLVDSLSNLWPVKNENDAGEVTEALMPLRLVAESRSVVCVHHLNKLAAGGEGTATRGSGALTAFVDSFFEFRRFAPDQAGDRRRVINGYGRDEDMVQELVVQMDDDGRYEALGDRRHVADAAMREVIASILPGEPPGLTAEAIHKELPEDEKAGRTAVYGVLKRGRHLGWWSSSGAGKKGDPLLFWGHSSVRPDSSK